MTRQSRREIERAVEDLAGGGETTIREWLQEYALATASETGVRLADPDRPTHPYADPEVDTVVAYVDTDGAEYCVPAADLPAWIDVEDLPLQGDAGDSNPFILADFTSGAP